MSNYSFAFYSRIPCLGDVIWELTIMSMSFWGLSPGTVYQITNNGAGLFANMVQIGDEDDNVQNRPKLRKNRRCFRNSYCSTGQFVYGKYLYLSAPKIVFQTKTILKRGRRCKMHEFTHPKCILCNFCEKRNEKKSDHCFVSVLSLSRWPEEEW